MEFGWNNRADGPPDAKLSRGARAANLPGRPLEQTQSHRAGPTYLSGDLVTLDAGAEVIAERSSGRHIWLIRSGILRLQRFSFDGRRQILALALPGEIIGYETPWRSGLSVETATRAKLCRIDRRDFEDRLDADAVLRREFAAQQQDHIERLRWLTCSIGSLRPEERLSAFLALATCCMPYQPLPDGTAVLTMLISRADMADLLATTMETISRVTHALEEDGVVTIVDPAHFRIVDLKKLAALGRISDSFEDMATRLKQPRDRCFLRAWSCGSCVSRSAC
ncbi:helix-turn-helix domain-containing protein [bacterium]|nr:helix-turn-helix domain-containing protein [bacterium]